MTLKKILAIVWLVAGFVYGLPIPTDDVEFEVKSVFVNVSRYIEMIDSILNPIEFR